MKSINQGSTTRRATCVLTRLSKQSGQLAGATLGDIQDQKPEFKFKKRCRGEHSWLYGTDNAVCSRCGATVPKHQAQSISGTEPGQRAD